MSDIQITKKFGQYSVTALDSNGVRVQVEPGQCTFATRDEAPEGFFAVLKSSLPQDKGNLCRFCDWRRQCNDETTDLTAPGHRCMGYAVIASDGRVIERQDGCSVVFKSRDPNFSDPYWSTI